MSTEDQVPKPASRRNWLRRHWFGVSLILLITGGWLLDLTTVWKASEGSEVPTQFTVLLFNKTADRLDPHSFQRLPHTVSKLEADGIDYSFLLPPDASQNYPFADSDSFFSVDRVTDQQQVITFHYELGILNHGWSKYLAEDKTIKPLAEQASDGLFFALALVIALASWIVWLVFKLGHLLYKGISRLSRGSFSDE